MGFAAGLLSVAAEVAVGAAVVAVTGSEAGVECVGADSTFGAAAVGAAGVSTFVATGASVDVRGAGFSTFSSPFGLLTAVAGGVTGGVTAGLEGLGDDACCAAAASLAFLRASSSRFQAGMLLSEALGEVSEDAVVVEGLGELATLETENLSSLVAVIALLAFTGGLAGGLLTPGTPHLDTGFEDGVAAGEAGVTAGFGSHCEGFGLAGTATAGFGDDEEEVEG